MHKKSYCLILLKPDALERGLSERILDRFLEVGFTVEAVTFRTIDRDLILAHYADAIRRVGPELEERVVNSYLGRRTLPLVLGLPGEGATTLARSLLGATDPSRAEKGTIRGDFGIDSIEAAVAECRVCENLVHCSDSPESFRHEMGLWFEPETCARFE
jgi:nucleoside-diphosphate kinase